MPVPVYRIAQFVPGSDRWFIELQAVDGLHMQKVWIGTLDECRKLAAVYESFGVVDLDTIDEDELG